MRKSLAALVVLFFSLVACASETPGSRAPNIESVSLTVELHEGKTMISTSTITAQDGYTKSLMVNLERQGPKKERDDLWLIMTPSVSIDGSINVDFSARKSEVTIQNALDAGKALKVPLHRDLAMRLKLSMQEGKPLELPFGPTNSTPKSQYVLKLVASRVSR